MDGRNRQGNKKTHRSVNSSVSQGHSSGIQNDSVMRKDAEMSRRVVPATNILHLATLQSKVTVHFVVQKRRDGRKTAQSLS
jgi:hypothetical protein